MSKLGLILALSTFISLTSIAFGDVSPSLVIEVFRHGAKSPDDGEYDNTWDPTTYGQLTPVGMRMQYLLGSALRQEYPEILGKPFSRDRFYARSSPFNRTVESLEAQLFGALEGTGPGLGADYPTDRAVPPFSPQIVDDLLEDMDNSQAIPGGYVPVAIETVPDDIVLMTPGTCPANFLLGFARLLTPKSVKFWEEELPLTKQTLKEAGFSVSNPYDLGDIAEILMCDYAQNKTLPANITYGSELYKNITFAGVWYDVLTQFTTKTQKQLLGVPLYEEIMGYLDAKAANQTSLEFIFLSTHDVTLMTILASLDIVTEECLMENYLSDLKGEAAPYPNCVYPPFAANILLEFYENNANPYVIFKYNGVAIPICGDSVECSYSDFKALIKEATGGYTVADYKVRCLEWLFNGIGDVVSAVESIV